MNYIIHLTDRCNMNCKYCYEHKKDKEITFDNIKKLVDNIIENDKSKSTVLSFYGGEPLLKFEMIKDTIEYVNSKEKKIDFMYSITTNGTLITDEVIDFFNNNNFVFVQLSIDGAKESHDENRVFQSGNATFDTVINNAKKLLEKYHGDVIANKVLTKNNLKSFDTDVRYLFDAGLKEIYVLVDYSADWTDEDLPVLREKLTEVSKIYADEMMKENDVTMSIFDEKIKTYIDDAYNCNDGCKMGMKTINVGTDGNFYPCMQFVDNSKYVIGNCEKGVDTEARINLIKSSGKEINTCIECDLRKRCKHTCPCKNYSLTGDVNVLSPIVCEFERIIIEVSDRMAEELYKSGSKMFIQKYYNENYALIRFIEKKMKEK